MKYNPFEKPIAEISGEDLKILIKNKVSEGWFVEYKEQFPNNKKISHSIASFANSEGGWYIVGIKDDENNVATNIDGFSLLQIKEPKEHLRNIIVGHLNPIPHFTSNLIKLESGKYVLVCYVDKGFETPYLTKDGRVYVRSGEGSDPVYETNKYLLQKLFERNDYIKNIS